MHSRALHGTVKRQSAGSGFESQGAHKHPGRRACRFRILALLEPKLEPIPLGFDFFVHEHAASDARGRFSAPRLLDRLRWF